MDNLAAGLDAETPELEELRRQVRDLERRLAAQGDLGAQLKAERERADRVDRELAILEKGDHSGPPKWTTASKRKPGRREAQPWLLLSDLHLDEVVDPEQIFGFNKYNREIALQRLARLTANFIDTVRCFDSRYDYPGVTVAMLGDNFPGLIHEELTETNEDEVLGSLEFWVEPLAGALVDLADEFGKVYVPVIVGNHGRLAKKPKFKGRVRNNLDWKLGCDIRRMLRHDNRITVDVSPSMDMLVDVYDKKIMLNHGEAGGGNGWGGAMLPVARLEDRKQRRQVAVKQSFDLLAVGHWHHFLNGDNWVINGCMVGYEEFAFGNNFSYQDAQQAAFLVEPGYGKTLTAPIFCQDREAEGW